MSGWGTIYNNTRISLSSRMAELSRLQEQAASGRRVLRPSDDPGAAYRILGLQQEQRDTEAYMDNLHTVMMGLENASSTLQQVGTNLVRVKELLTQASSDTYSDANRRTIAMEIDGILEDCLNLGNSSIIDRYLFAGTQVSRPPFQAVRQDGRITGAVYQGSHSDLYLPVAPGVAYHGTLIGDTVFQVHDRRDPTFYGTTGAVPGSGTSSLTGQKWLTFSHTVTTYAGATGIAAGASSPEHDTILGNGHTLTIDADALTVRLDNGPAQSYSPLTTDLALTNENGDVVYVDTSGVTLAAGQQTVAIEARGRATLNDGATYTDVNSFADNLAVTDGTTGRVLYVNTSNLARVGTEAVSVRGTYDLFETLARARDVLLDSANLTQQKRSDLLTDSMAALEEVMGGISDSMTAAGSRLQALDLLNTSLENVATNAKTEASAIGEVDIAELTIELAKSQNLYQMTLLSVSKLLGMSLLDFLT